MSIDNKIDHDRKYLPNTMTDITIERPYNMTKRNEPFLVYDSEKNDSNRLIIFAFYFIIEQNKVKKIN